MDPRDEDTVRRASAMIVTTLLECEGEELQRDPRRLDAVVREILRAMGRLTVTDAFDERGLSTRTQTTCVADGGNGLREEVAAQFAGSRFVLDRPHRAVASLTMAAVSGVPT